MNAIARTRNWTAGLLKRAAGGLEWVLRQERGPSGFGWAGGVNTTGVKVDVRSMFALAVARRCIDAVASDLAAMPLSLVRITDQDEEVPAVDHRAYSLFKWSPDGQTTPMRFRQALVGNSLAWGNGYAEIVESPDRTAVQLQILNPSFANPGVDEAGRLYYQVEGKRIDGSKVVHVAGLGFDGLRGYPPWQLHAQTLGLTVVAERFGGAFLGNGAFPGGFIESPFEMGEEAFTSFRNAFVKQHAGGAEKAGKIGFLPPGFKFSAATINPQAAQLMELRLFQILEVCRIFGVPPHRVMQYENMHYSTVEAVKSEFAQTTLLPAARGLEEALNLRLLTKEEVLAGYTFRHDFTSYMRADSAARAVMYRTLWSMDALNANEARVGEGYPLREGGDVYFSDLKSKSAPKPAPVDDQPKDQQS